MLDFLLIVIQRLFYLIDQLIKNFSSFTYLLLRIKINPLELFVIEIPPQFGHHISCKSFIIGILKGAIHFEQGFPYFCVRLTIKNKFFVISHG